MVALCGGAAICGPSGRPLRSSRQTSTWWLGEGAVAQHASAVDAAQHVGANASFTPAISASPASLFEPARDHAATEKPLATTGVPSTALRESSHAATVPQNLLSCAVETGQLVEGARRRKPPLRRWRTKSNPVYPVS